MKNYINSLLADISYIDYKFLNGKWESDDLSSNLTMRGIKEEEKLFFTSNFKVIDQTSFGSGFSATTFQVKTNDVPGYAIGDIFVGYRGTEDSVVGLFTDGLYTDLGNVSLGTSSIVDVFSKSIEVMTGSDFSITQATSARQYLANISQLPEAQGRLITVTGHSLGGYLATYATLTNSSVVKEAITFNAPAMFLLDGLVANAFNMLASENSNVTLDGVTTQESSDIAKKIFHFYSNVSIELTASSNPLNSYIGTRIPLYAEDISGISNHFVKYTREAMFVYESLRLILNIPVEQAYAQVTSFLERFKYPNIEKNYFLSTSEKIQLNMFKSTQALSFMLGLNNGIEVLVDLSLHHSIYSFLEAKSDFSITTNNNYNNRSKLYSVFNYVPFIIQSNINSNFIYDQKYNPSLYRQEFLDSRVDFYKKIIVAADKDLTQNNYDNADGYNTLLYTFFESTGGEKMAYVDYTQKLVLLQNMTREEFFTNLSIKKVYYIDSPATGTITITGDNSTVFDSFGNDNFHINGANTNLYLTSGNDTIIVNVDKGGSLGIVESVDGGIGDIFYILGDKETNFIDGTKYTDNIRGGLGDDVIKGMAGNDVIYGGLGNDVLLGGDGNDTIYGNDSTVKTGAESDSIYQNTINGGKGIDTIFGGEGVDIINNVSLTDDSYLSIGGGDIITGGKGDDIIYGTRWDNKYNYALGDGNDTIIERNLGAEVDSQYNGYVDSIYFTNVSASEVTFAHNGTANLYMTLPDGAVITFTNFMKLMFVERFVFGSTVLLHTDILTKVLERTVLNAETPLLGNDNIDIFMIEVLKGQANIVNKIEGGYGKDKIFGGNLNDILGNASKSSTSYISNIIPNQSDFYGDDFTGGKGNDTIYGTAFGDNYYYNKGDGNDIIIEQTPNNQNDTYIDKIILGQGITRSNTTIVRDFNNNVILKFNFGDTSSGEILMKDFINGLGVEKIIFGDSTVMTSAQILAEALTFYGTEQGETILGTAKNDIIYGNGGSDIIYGFAGDDKLFAAGPSTLDGGAGKDELNGSNYNDTLLGGLDVDIINGGDGDDTINSADKNSDSYKGSLTTLPTYNAPFGDIITGGKGNDTIHGTAFSDTFYYRLGDGNDQIYDYSGALNSYYLQDKIVFQDIYLEDIKVSRDQYSLKINVNSGGSVEFIDFYKGNYTELFEFRNGITLGYISIIALAEWKGTNEKELMEGSPYNDIIYGNGGGDTIIGYGGINHLYGGTGDDFIYMRSANNPYTDSNHQFSYVEAGDGIDTIGDESAVNGFSNSRVDITGGKGDDIIFGSLYANIYRVNIGDGNDKILTSARGDYGYDTLIFGQEISSSDVKFERENNKDLRVKYTTNDSVLVLNYFSTESSLKIFQFSNGEVLDLTKPNQQYFTNNGTDGNDIITYIPYLEIVKAGDGNDTITNYFENSQRLLAGEYYGEAGNDTLNLRGTGMTVSGGAGVNHINLQGDNRWAANTVLFSSAGESYDYLRTDYYSSYILKFDTNFSDFSIVYMKKDLDNILTMELKYADKSFINFSNQGYDFRYYSFQFNDATVNFANLAQQVQLTDIDDYFYGNYFNSVVLHGGGGRDNIQGSNGNDVLYGDAELDLIQASNGNDIIYGGDGNDSLHGDSGNDVIYGEEGNDTLDSGTGALDFMYGGNGNDIYHWKSTSAVISDTSGNDRVYLYSSSRSYMDYHFEKVGMNLVINNKLDPNASLTIVDHYGAGAVETITFPYNYGYNLVGDRINNLVNLMAEFDATSDPDVQNEINTRIVQSWTPS